jgi:hypothetical protein
VSHFWFYQLTIGLVWFLFLLGGAVLLWRLGFLTLGRCAIALVLYLGVYTHYWWWVRIIFWFAIFIGIVGGLWYHAWNDRRLPHVSNNREVSWRDSQVKRFARTASIVALAIPAIRLLVMLIGHLWRHWSFGTLFNTFALLAIIAFIVLLLFGRWVAAVVLAIVAIATFASASLFGSHGSNTSHGGGSSSTGTPSSSPSSSASGSLTEDQRKAQATAQASLIVNYGDVANVQMCNSLVAKYFGAPKLVSYKLGNASGKTPVFDVGATHSVVGSAPRYPGEVQRLWSFATNIPLATPTLEMEQATVCHDPAQAGMVMSGMGPGIVGGITVAHQNPWMIDGSQTVDTWAQKCMTQNVSTHLQCAQTMAATAALLGRFHSAGVSVRHTAWNVRLIGGGLKVNGVPAFGLNSKQYTGYFLVVEMTEKTGGCFLRYGFNVGVKTINGGDQRIAGLTCVPPKPPKKPTPHPTTTPSTHKTTTPVCTSNCTTTSRPTCRTHCTTTTRPTCRTHCKTTPPKKCACVTKTQVSQTPAPPPPDTRPVPTTAPSRQPTKPVDTQNPATNRPGGYDGGSTTNPVVTGNPTPVDTGHHTAPIPTPTSGPFG